MSSLPVSIKKQQGFTLLEMITVIIILGVMSVGITSFIKIATQSYVNVSERDELISSARFAVERLNREVRSALPNSAREFSFNDDGTVVNCLEFVPIITSSAYLNLSKNVPTSTMNVIEFIGNDLQPYDCDDCGHHIAIYALSTEDIYVDPSQITGQVFSIDSIDKDIVGNDDVWQMSFGGNVTVENLSPTSRFYVINTPVSYCVDDRDLYRVSNYSLSDGYSANDYPESNTKILMAENVDVSFYVEEATLTRNSIVTTELTFSRSSDSSETIVLNHDIHISNTP